LNVESLNARIEGTKSEMSATQTIGLLCKDCFSENRTISN